MKKLFYLLLVVGLGVTVAACGNSTTTTTTTTKPTTQQTTTKPTTTENKDKISPVIDLKTTTAEVMKGEQLFDARANISDAFDNADSNVSPDNVQIDMGGYEGIDSEVGTYTITYSIADNAGNTTIATCTVTVVEVEPSILFTGADGLEYSWPMNYNPVLGAQYTQGYGLDQWAYELTKVTVLSKDYFEWLNDNMYERISASWSFVMVADSDLEIVYVRDHMSNEFYTEEGVVVNKVSTDWCTGTPTGGNDQYCGVTQGRQTANLVDKIPDGGYVIVFINNGPNTGDCPRAFGQRIYDTGGSTGGVGQKVSLVGAGKDFGSTNAPAYVKTTETHIDAYYGSELNLLDGISYVSYNNTADLDIEVEVYPIVGGLADLANPADAIDTTAPQAGADGLVPETSYVVKYTIEENGRTDFLIRSYTLKEDSSTVSAYQQRFTLGEKSTLVYLNDADALVAHDSGLGMAINTNDRPHLMDIPTILAQLQAQKDAGKEKVTYQYGAYYVLDKDLKVVQIVFAIGLDVSVVKDAEGNWVKTDLGTGSIHNLLNDFLGETPLVDLSKAAFVLFTQNTSANNATVRQFGVDLWNTDGQFKINGSVDYATFNQQVLLENAAVITQEGINTAGKVLETKTYTVTSALADASGKVYETSFNHGWYWSEDTSTPPNTWLRFYPNMLHVVDKEFAGTLESLNAYIPWASAVILDKDLKVVAIRSFYEEMVDGTQHKALKYVSKNEAGEFVVLDAQNNEDGNWNGYNNYDAVSKIAEYIPEGGYAFPLITSATITNPLLKAILDDVENPTAINDYQFTWVYQLAIAE